MTEKFLGLLENSRGKFLSGEDIARSLGVTRAAVCKAVNKLKSRGYEIEAVRGKGYCLSQASDIVSAQGIMKYLDPDLGVDIHVYPALESTMTKAREMAEAGKAEGTVVIACVQTGGKGRRGRSFFSPEGAGLYMSLLLRPDMSSDKATSITTRAAVAACGAIEELGAKPSIKWVNDVYVSGKKACGILTEASLDLENDRMNYAILGVGFNLYRPKDGFPKELDGIAGAISDFPLPDGKNRLAAGFLDRFLRLYADNCDTSYVQSYKERCFVLGRKITVLRGDNATAATALDLDDQCHLKVRYEDGTTEFLSSGEISIRV